MARELTDAEERMIARGIRKGAYKTMEEAIEWHFPDEDIVIKAKSGTKNKVDEDIIDAATNEPSDEQDADMGDEENHAEHQYADDQTDDEHHTSTDEAAPDLAAQFKLLQDNFTKLESDYSAMKGRVAPLQSQLAFQEQQNKALLEAITSKQMNTTADIAGAVTGDTTEKLITSALARLKADESFTDVDENALKALASVVASVVSEAKDELTNSIQSKIEQDREHRKKEKADRFKSTLLQDQTRLMSQVPALAQDQRFNAWAEENPSVAMVMNAFMTATDEKVINTLAKEIEKSVKTYYTDSNIPLPVVQGSQKQQPSTPTQKQTVSPQVGRPLADSIRRKPQQSKQLTHKDVEALTREHKALSRKSNKTQQDIARMNEIIAMLD